MYVKNIYDFSIYDVPQLLTSPCLCAAHPCFPHVSESSGGWPEASCRPVGWNWWRKGACRHHPFISCWAKSLWSEILPHHCPSVQLPTTHILSFISQIAICLPWHTSTWLRSICVLITSHKRTIFGWREDLSTKNMSTASLPLHKLMVYEI